MPRDERVILVCDDDEDTIGLIETLLSDLPGVRTIAARTGREAVSLATKLRPSLVLLDMLMPDLDGREVTHRLKAQPATRSIPIVAVTAISNASQVAAETGCDACVEKPFDIDFLRDKVKDCLARAA